MGKWVEVSGYKVYNKFPIDSQFVSKPDRLKGEIVVFKLREPL